MHHLTLPNLCLHYAEAGAGTPILLIHGHPFDCTSWSPQLDAALPGLRLIAPDLRNFGLTTSPTPPTLFADYARDLIALADALALPRFVALGLSMGGHVVLELAALAPSRLLGLVLCGTYAQLDSPEKKASRYALADRLDREGLAPYAAEVLPKMLSAQSLAHNPALAAPLLAMMQRCPAAGASIALRLRAEHPDYLPVLSSLSTPTLILVGEHDAFTPVPDAQLMHAHARNSTLVVLPSAGHLTNLEQPAAFNDSLLTFLASLPRAPQRTA
jgi:pimeloyl-ACP methyl ester carboxylesterase